MKIWGLFLWQWVVVAGIDFMLGLGVGLVMYLVHDRWLR